MGKIAEGVWDCRYCKTVRILGRHRECPHCGKPRDSSTTFYMTDKPMYVPEEKAKEISRNPDWVCRFCDCLNPDTTKVCISCGASRTAENLNYFENQKEKQKQATQTSKQKNPDPVTIDEQDIVIQPPKDDNPEPEPEAYVPPVVPERNEENDYSSQTNPSYQEEEIPTTWNKVKKFVGNAAEATWDVVSDALPAIGLIALILLIIGGIWWLAASRTKTVTVNHTYWENVLEIERYQTVDESGWSLPANARLHETKSEIYTYERVLDHYENKTRQVAKQRIDHYEERVVGYKDLGNGYFEEQTERVPVYETYYETEHYQEPVYRSDPVYKTKYYYEIDKWLHDRNLTTSGVDSEPTWADTSNLKSDERTGSRKSSYSFSGTDEEGETKNYDASYSDWSCLNPGDVITIKVSIFGNVRSVEYPS